MRLLTALVLALALALAVASSAQAQTVSGRAHVLDGDTIEVAGVRVRLEGLHCPEGNEPGGSVATSAMRGLTRGQHVTCSLTGERTYDRMIGTCYVGDTDLTAAIIRQGACARCPRYDPGERYLPAQRDAGAVARVDARLLLSRQRLSVLLSKSAVSGPASCATPAPSPSSWPRWRSPARWCAPSSPPSAAFERHRYVRDRDPDPN